MMLPRRHSSTKARTCASLSRRELGERVLGRDRDEGDAHDRVGARREDLELALLPADVVGEREVHALAAADPVRLHGAHAVGPVGQLVERREQLVGVAA